MVPFKSALSVSLVDILNKYGMLPYVTGETEKLSPCGEVFALSWSLFAAFGMQGKLENMMETETEVGSDTISGLVQIFFPDV